MANRNKSTSEIIGDVAVICFVLLFVLPFIAFAAGFIFWVPWTLLGIGTTYFNFLPEAWQSPGIMDCFLLIWVLKSIPAILIPSRTTQKVS